MCKERIHMPQFKDCISKVKIGDTLYSGFPLKPCKPNLKPKIDVITVPNNAFSTISNEASQAVKNTFSPTNTKYSFPINATKVSESTCEMWKDIGNSLI